MWTQIFRQAVAIWLVCFSQPLIAQGPIDSIGVVKIGGIRQVISIKGRDTSKPLLLFLHGGPGNSVMHYAERFTYRLQEHFIVVQWDQREVGKTLASTTYNSSVPHTRKSRETTLFAGLDPILLLACR